MIATISTDRRRRVLGGREGAQRRLVAGVTIPAVVFMAVFSLLPIVWAFVLAFFDFDPRRTGTPFLGGLTLLIHDATFIKWKPSIVNWLFAAAFLVSQYTRGPTIVQRMLGENVTLDAGSWKRLNLMWVGFFVFAGTLNILVAYRYDEATWVNFKLFGLMGLTLAFALAQGVWIARKTEAGVASEAK